MRARLRPTAPRAAHHAVVPVVRPAFEASPSKLFDVPGCASADRSL